MAAPSSPDGLDELRDLLVSPEREAIESLRARLDDPALRARELAAGIPDALAHCDDDRLSEVLTPPVESALTRSVRRNPRPMAEALFPVMGPAIRKAITHALSGMIESLSRTLEHSVSVRALKWRLVAWRTGKSFAEVVLLNTLVYRVEQVFLIHASTGLLLQHVVADSVSAQDADMVSGMLTAIRDFARDSFGGRAEDTLETFRVGELTGVVEQGPHAYVAAVVRGATPPDLRPTLQHAIETIHLQFADELEHFSGDAARFEGARPALQECLEAQYRDSDEPRSYRRWWLAAGVVLVLLAAWGGVRWVDRMRFARYVAALDAQPGMVVVGTRREGGRFVVTGLRDPLAPESASFVAASGLKAGDVTGHWRLFQAMDPRLAVARARAVLRPPPGVVLTMRGDTLVAAGEAPLSWIRDAELLARTVPGVRQFESGGPPERRAQGDQPAPRSGEGAVRPRDRRSGAGPGDGTGHDDPGAAPAGRQGARGRRALSRGGHGTHRRRRPARAEPGAQPGAGGLGHRRAASGRADGPRVRRAGHGRHRAGLRRHHRGGQTAQPPRRGATRAAGCRSPSMIQKKICMLGSFSVGKTSLVARFVSSVFSEKYLTTVGVKIDKKTLAVNGTDVTLMLWDIYGEDDFQKVRMSYLRGAGGYLLVVDGTRRATLDIALALQRTVAEQVGPLPFVLCLNKADLKGQWEIDLDLVAERARSEGWLVIETSAKLGTGVEEAFSSLATRMLAAGAGT